MPSLLDIKARIGAIENIKKITRAMQLVAAAKFNRSQNRARSARPYANELDRILQALAGASEGESDATLELSFGDGDSLFVDRSRLFEQNEVKKPGIVLVTADRGLCGSFNSRLIRAADDFMRENADKDNKLITLGKRGHLYFKNRKVEIIHREQDISDKLELDEIKRITRTLIELFVSGEVDALYIIYAQFKTAMVNRVTIDKFLSIPTVDTGDATDEEVYILEPGEAAVYETLIPQYAATKMYAALADSFASEYGSRMVAMQTATKNAEDVLDYLVILRNRMRQAMITKELSEIVSGAKALE